MPPVFEKPVFEKPMFSKHYRIYLEDTDAGGIVYHANHLKLFERCRRDWLRELGMVSYFYQQHSVNNSLTTHQQAAVDVQFVVSQANIHYHRPILLDTEVTVTITAVNVKAASLQLDQRIYDSTNQLMSQADIHIVCVTTNNTNGQTHVRPTRLPTDFVRLITD